jgi:hypothetical protein
MSYLSPSTSSFQSTERISQRAMSSESQRQRYCGIYPVTLTILWVNIIHRNSLHATSVHILDDDSLLNIFHLYRPFILVKTGISLSVWRGQGNGLGNGGGIDSHTGTFVKDGGWRSLIGLIGLIGLILGSASYLGLCVGTPPLPSSNYRHHDWLL